MSRESNTIVIEVDGGPQITVPWTDGLNAQRALERAWDEIAQTAEFTYALQYFGTKLGYLVNMVNETYDTFGSTSDPFFYWQVSVNGVPSNTGIAQIALQPSDIVTLSYERYDNAKHSGSPLAAKHDVRRLSARRT